MAIKKVVVIGAGVSGLAAAIYARQAGHHVTVLEKCPNPGGVSTSWKRKGYLFEGGIHWLIGSTPVMKTAHERWLDTGALKENNPIHFKDPIFTFVKGDVKINLWRNLDKFCDELLQLCPEDSKAIRRFRKDVSLCSHFFGALDLPNERRRRILLLPAFICAVVRLLTQSVEEYAGKFRTAILRDFFSTVISKNHNAISLVYTIATYAVGDSGYPEGGSLRLAQNMADNAEQLGCDIRYKTTVEKVCVDDGKVCGVISDGQYHEADNVIVASNTLRAIDKLFDTPIEEKWARKMRASQKSLTCMFLSLGVEADLSHYPEGLHIVLDKPLNLAGHEFPIINMSNYSWQRGYAPEGHTALTLIFIGDTYEWWQKAKEDGRYEQEKKAVTDAVIAALEQYIPECKGKVAVTDLATPLTYERYCDTHHGEWMTVWHKNTIPPMIPAECKSIKGLHFAGQRTMLSGGLPIATMTGQKAAMAIGPAN